MTKQGKEILYVVIDIRNNETVWYGSKEDCKWWVSDSKPYNRKFYIITQQGGINMNELEEKEKMSEKIKTIKEMLAVFELNCIETCRDKKTGESNPYQNEDTAIFSFEGNSYIMFKNDIETAKKIICYILGEK